MDENEQGDDDGTRSWVDEDLVERADLSETPEGRALAAAFIAAFGDFVSGSVRPVLREVADAGGEPQLLVNGLAQLLREVAATMEFPIGVERPGAHEPGSGD